MKDLGFLGRLLRHHFAELGFQVGCHPWRFILGSLILSVGLSLGVLKFNFKLKILEFLAPYNSRYVAERELIETYFPSNSNFNFDLWRTARLDRFGRLIILAKDGGNMLRTSIFDELVLLDEMIRNITIPWEGKKYAFEDICARNKGKCVRNEILDLAPRMRDFEKGYLKIKYPVYHDSRSLSIRSHALELGGVELDDKGFVESGKAISLWYVLDFDDVARDDLFDEWEDHLVRTLAQYPSDVLDISVFTSEMILKEANSTILFIMPYLIIAIVIALGFSMVANMMADWTLSKPWLGIIAMITASLGSGAAFGICQLLGYPAFCIHIVIVLMMIGIGLDDTFVLVAAWRKSDPQDSPERRLRATYDHCGIAVTITSLTNFLSFCIGLTTPFPVTFLFCIYSAFAVLTCYLLTLTLFGACMALFGRVEQRNLHGLTCVHQVVPRSLARNESRWFRLLCTGGKNPEDPKNPLDNREHFMMVFFRDSYGRFLFSRMGLMTCLLVYAIYLTAGIWGTKFLSAAIEEEGFVNKNSYAFSFFENQYKYFRDYQARGQIVIDEKLDYSVKSVQDQIEAIIQRYESDPQIADRGLTESWLRQYLLFLKVFQLYTLTGGLDCVGKEGFVYCLRNLFLKIPGFHRFRGDIAFNSNGTEILATRYFLVSKDISSPLEGVNLRERIEGMRANSPIRLATVYCPLLIFLEHVSMLKPVLFTSVVIAIGVMILVSIVFIPKLEFFLVVGFTIVSVEVGLLGLVSLHGIPINMVNVVFFIISVGFSVDNSVHVMCAYRDSTKETTEEKFRDALYSIGLPIVQGSVTTLIAVVPFQFFSSRIYKESSIFMCYVFLSSLTHSICFIPVFYYLVVSLTNSLRKKMKRTIKNPETILLKLNTSK